MSRHWHKRLLGPTQARIVALLRRSSSTVNDLAAALHVTDNAIRAQLASLARDGLVEQVGTRPGPRKPNLLYALTPEAEELFPKLYAPLITELLSLLKERLSNQDVGGLLREVGRRLAASKPRPTGGLEQRARAALHLLRTIGGSADLEREDGRLVVRGHGCPLAAALPEHPELCGMVETLLAEVIGAKVRECCERSEPPEPPQCCFVIEAPEEPVAVAAP